MHRLVGGYSIQGAKLTLQNASGQVVAELVAYQPNTRHRTGSPEPTKGAGLPVLDKERKSHDTCRSGYARY